MPYGTESDRLTDNMVLNQTFYQQGLNPQYSTNDWTQIAYKKSFSRSGSNVNVIRTTPSSSSRGSWVEITKVVPKGPRLAYKVYSSKAGRFVWARQLIVVRRMKFVRPPKKKKVQKLFTKPNSLNFSSHRVTPYGVNSIRAVHANKSVKEITGPLWMQWKPIGTNTFLNINTSSYLGSGFSSIYDSKVASLTTRALNGLYDKVKNQKVNLAQALAERRRTIESVAQLVVRAAQTVAMAKKGNIVGAAKKLFPGDSKQLANDYLLWQYGLKPLLSDIEGAVDHLANPENIEFDLIVKRSETIPRTVLAYASPNGACAVRTEVTTQGKVDVSYKVRLRLKGNQIREFNRLGFTNLLSLGYELIPFSFVVDWFLPIGNYLNNMDAFAGLELVYAHKTVFKKEVINVKRTFGGTDSYGFVWYDGTSGFVNERISCVRTVENLSTLKLALPSFKDPVSTSHVATAMALLRQLKK